MSPSPKPAGRKVYVAEGPEDRGAETREKLLDAALDLFGSHGFEATSTRALADRAGVNLGAIPYYFGSKEGLYLAVADHITSQMRSRLGPAVAEITTALEKGVTPDEARRLLKLIADRFLDVVVGNAGGGRWGPYIIREQMSPTAAFDRVFEGFISPTHALVCRLVVAARGGRASPDDALQVFTLIGQMIVFRAARAAVLRKLQWDGMTEDHLARIKRVVHGNLDALLDWNPAP